MQNLTTSANFQMFSKVHHDAVPSHTQQSPRTNVSVSAGDIGEQQGKGQHGQLSAADLHQIMLNQLDQQLYLSQFAGLGASSDASGAAPPPDSSSSAGAVNLFQHFSSSADLPTSSAAVCHASDSATTTTSSACSTSSATDGKPCAATGASGGMYGADSSLSSAELLGQQLTHQKLMEQFLEVATTVAGGGGGNQQQMSGGSTTPSAEEMMVSQLMAQLVNGTSVPNGGGTETHGQMTAQHQFGTGGAHQQQQQQHQSKTDGGSQSPSSSSHNQQQPLSMSLIDQLQILQMLGSPGANPQSLSGFAELFAAGGLPSSTSSENLAQLLKGVGGAGGSPSKAEQVYCELCDKWLCNRYFMKTHMLKKHGIGEATSTTNSPLKNGVGNFSFASSAQFSADEHSVRPNSASAQPPQMELMAHHHNESPPVGRLAPKLSLSSTPGTISGNGPGDNQTTAFIEALSPDHSQQMAVMQQLAAQLGLSNGGNATEGERNALEQLLGSGGLHLAELMAHAQNQQQNNDMNRCPSPSSVRSPPATLSCSDHHHHQSQQNVPSSAPSSSFACAQCAKYFPSQSALFQHQLIAHVGGTDAPQQQQQQSTASNDTQSTVNALAMLAAAGINGGNGTTQQQQQQLFGQLLGSNPFSQGTTPSLMFNNSSAFGGINPTEFDGAAMLAKLSAEFAAVAQAQHGQSGTISATTAQSTGGPSTQQNGAMGRGHTPAPSNKPPPQKRQYSSTSKNFCDLCNKEVCNKYFLRTHMLKMHNIIIDENKQLIANIDTVDKERKGEVKFRCDICHTSMNTREELKLHKRESHGMHAGGGGSQSAPLGGARGVPKATSSSASQPTAVSMDTAEANPQQQQQKRVALPSFAPVPSHFNAIEQQPQQQQQSTQRRTTSEGTGANDENNQPLGEHSPQQQQQQTREAAGAQQPSLVGANPMKQLLSLIGGDEALPPSLVGGARLHRTTGERNDLKKDTEEEHLGHRIADANNNATNCRFCGLCLEEEGQLQLHQLMEHPNEYMAELQPIMDLPHSASTEDKLINQVALQMAEANSHNHHHHHQQQQHQHQRQFPQLRKTSVASSGASSSSAASFGEVGTAHPPQQQKTKKGTPSRGENADGDDENGGGGGRHQCPQCKRIYKSAQRLEGHQRMVHHNFVAKMSPAKRSIISPKKIAKLMSSFSCHKCRRRFASRGECDEHVLSHIRSGRLKHEEAEDEQPQEEEEEGGERVPQVKRAKMGEDDEVAEQHHREDGAVEEKANITGRGVEEEERHQRAQRRTKGATGGGEKHSHTSGSTSPVSVQAGSSGGALPEGFAHPLLDHTKPFVLQSFTLRPVSPHSNCQLPDELVAYLPVRSTLGQPIRVTFELNPTPHVDQQVQHL
ncbi:hypothetical protein niasHT_007783 [Heterodera trifolii]|uniref:C2H2-type domain-containing protein n=1 Tax=Heterodera trifolii TaxID=157864 RepID=A0ABD2LKL2_9BILA